tara:strand:+ start:1779 stop:2639 length:861 start_codon:yes stop_codon:yes gene_type:complete
MCIAIMKSAKKKITKATLQRCYDANPDGAGFMYAENKELNVQKGFFTFKEFYKEYKPHENKQVLLHFRIKTHGKIDKNNCHPFLVNNSLGFIHNGIITGYGDDKQSDTIDFNKSILQKIVAKHGNNSLFDDPMVELIENVIGYSKLVFLDRHGNYKIMNEGKGEWKNGIWYSNSSYKKPEPIRYLPNYSRGYTYPNYNNVMTKSEGDWVQVADDHTIGKGDNTVILKKGEWLEVGKVNWAKNTCSLIEATSNNPNVYKDIDLDLVESWEDVTEVNTWNKSFNYGDM